MNNIDIFDRCTAHILAELYQKFPVPVDLNFADVPLDIFDESDTGADAFDKLAIYQHTIHWLISAGYMKTENINYDTASGVVLSPKGLEILKLPSSLESCSRSFGEQIVNSIKTGAISAAGDTAKTAITRGLEWILTN